MIMKCVICKKELERTDELSDFFVFTKNPDSAIMTEEDKFAICKECLNSMWQQIERIRDNVEEFKEHRSWIKKEKNRLELAKKITGECMVCSKKINQISDERIYDLMCERCWTQFRKEERDVQADETG